MNKYLRFLYDKKYRFLVLSSRGVYNSWSDERYLKTKFKIMLGYDLNLDEPKSFNEKLQWLKIYDRNPQYTQMVDKFEAKKITAKLIGEQYVVPTIGIWDEFDDIPFDILPNKFVMKLTNDSGGVYICDDKNLFDIDRARKNIQSRLKRNYYWDGREWPYKNIKPRILIEEYLEQKEQCFMDDYKMMCFSGKVKCSFVCTDRYNGKGLKVTFFDNKWNKLPFERHYPSSNDVIKKPHNLELMIELSQELSKNIPFVRIDWYEVEKKLFFGEYTFYPGSGMEEFDPISADYLLGKYIELPQRKQRIKRM